jgi:hypothetical protein
MEKQDKTERAWDDSLYKRGNLFVDGYANPIKPKVRYNKDLENPNTIDVQEGDTPDDREPEDDSTNHLELISSPRYREYMRQDLISQLLNPQEQWRLIVYGIIALGALQFLSIIITMYVTGGFS